MCREAVDRELCGIVYIVCFSFVFCRARCALWPLATPQSLPKASQRLPKASQTLSKLSPNSLQSLFRVRAGLQPPEATRVEYLTPLASPPKSFPRASQSHFEARSKKGQEQGLATNQRSGARIGKNGAPDAARVFWKKWIQLVSVVRLTPQS